MPARLELLQRSGSFRPVMPPKGVLYNTREKHMHISHICLFRTKIWKPLHPISPLKPFNKGNRKHVTLHATTSDLQAADLACLASAWRRFLPMRVDDAALASERSRTSGCAAAITPGRGAAAREAATLNTRGGKVSARAQLLFYARNRAA